MRKPDKVWGDYFSWAMQRDATEPWGGSEASVRSGSGDGGREHRQGRVLPRSGRQRPARERGSSARQANENRQRVKNSKATQATTYAGL